MIKPEGSVLKVDIRNSSGLKPSDSRAFDNQYYHDSFVFSGVSPFKKSQVESFNNIKSKLQFDIELSDEEGVKHENIED